MRLLPVLRNWVFAPSGTTMEDSEPPPERANMNFAVNPVFGVAFTPNAPLPEMFPVQVIATNLGPVRVANCTSVDQTFGGFLRLVPKSESGASAVALHIHPMYILWAIQAETAKQIGFAPSGFASAAPQSDQAG